LLGTTGIILVKRIPRYIFLSFCLVADKTIIVMKTEKEIKASDNKKVVLNLYDNNVISYVTRSHEDGKAIFYTLHFSRKSDKEFIKIPASLLSEIMSESGYKCSVRAFNTTKEDFNKFFSGANVKIIGVPFIKGTTKFLNPFNGNYSDGKPANNDGESLHIESFVPTKTNLAFDENQDKLISKGLEAEREAIRQATANYLASLL